MRRGVLRQASPHEVDVDAVDQLVRLRQNDPHTAATIAVISRDDRPSCSVAECPQTVRTSSS